MVGNGNLSKIHINNDGEPGKCKAEKGRCPFGEHFSSAEDARAAAEELYFEFSQGYEPNPEDGPDARRLYEHMIMDMDYYNNRVQAGKVAKLLDQSEDFLDEDYFKLETPDPHTASISWDEEDWGQSMRIDFTTKGSVVWASFSVDGEELSGAGDRAEPANGKELSVWMKEYTRYTIEHLDDIVPE